MSIRHLGIISCNRYCNFTNYGSALQTWALYQAVRKIKCGEYQPVLVNYCPDSLKHVNPLNPLENMWDTDEESRRMCESSLPAIRENYGKFVRFFDEQFIWTANKYTSDNFENIVVQESMDGFICGSDTIFCIDEFGGFDDGYFANYSFMKDGYTFAYAASFGDSHFSEADYEILNDRLQNFKYVGLRESSMLDYVRHHTKASVCQVADPTLLLTDSDYDCITAPRLEEKKYLLLYVRRYDPQMESFAENLAKERGWKVIEISLRAVNAGKPGWRMYYEAGVEEFLSLVKYAEFVVTNSFHGAIFSVRYRKPFRIFQRERCETKITELCRILGITKETNMHLQTPDESSAEYDKMYAGMAKFRKQSLDFLETALLECPGCHATKTAD